MPDTAAKYDITQEMNLLGNLFGPLKADIRERLQGYMNDPTIERWDDVHGIILHASTMLTFWQAVLKVKPDFPTRGRATDIHGKILKEWSEIPDQETALMAIIYAAYVYEKGKA